MFIANSIQHSNTVFNCFKKFKLGLFLSDVYLRHLMTIIISVFLYGYHGKVSSAHRTTIAHFLNHEKWDSDTLQDILKESIIHMIYQEAMRSGKPIFCMVDDTIASHTKLSSQAEHPIEAAYFHQSHLKNVRIMDIRHLLFCFLVMAWFLIMRFFCTINQNPKSRWYKRLQTNFQQHLLFPIFLVTIHGTR